TEKSHNFGLNYAHFTQKLYLSVTASHSFVNNSIERYDSLDVNEIMNSTYANIGQRRTTSLSTYFSWNPKTGTRIYSNNSLSYTHQVCDEMNLKNYGFTYNGSLGVQQTLFWDLRTSLNGGGSTKRYGLQGNSSGYLYYSLSLSRDFLKKKINVSIFGNNFLQPRRTYNRSTKGVGFTTYSKSSYYQASYGISVSYRIGKLQASVKKARRTITNDDVKSTGNGGVTGAGGGVGAQ
ncbi:MAG: outer membrane beta-barrel protein, partial [Bacteroidaceae bacterium]